MAKHQPRMCKLCGESPATLPDREKTMMASGRKEVCRQCHIDRLRGDWVRIMEARRKRAQETTDAE